MPEWRETILQHFSSPLHRLTLVADPDGLLLDEELLAAIRQNGYDLLSFGDPVAFRYAYESGYRRFWDEAQQTDLVVVLRSSGSSLRSLPYDLLQGGRILAFGLPELFPLLSYPVIRELDLNNLQPLYEAYSAYSGPEMGDRASAEYVLYHVYGVEPGLIRTPLDLLRLLLALHSRKLRLAKRLAKVLLDNLLTNSSFASWPVEALLTNTPEFLRFLQHQWRLYVASKQAATAVVEPAESYLPSGPMPFDAPEVRAYIDMLFLDGSLQPLSLPKEWTVDGWAQVGIYTDQGAGRLYRLTGLMDSLEHDLLELAATHSGWIEVAERWAELTMRYHEAPTELDQDTRQRYGVLHMAMEQCFTDWVLQRYHTLPSLPFLPSPTMVHHIPHWIAARLDQSPELRTALVVVDGLALDQWRVIRSIWAEEGSSWAVREGAAYAWVPTLTSFSRQALFAGTAPQFFPNSWTSTSQEEPLWRRFWSDKGLESRQVGYLRALGARDSTASSSLMSQPEATLETEVIELLDSPHVRVAGLVISTVDSIMHGMQLGTAGMHQQVRLWTKAYRYLSVLVDALLARDFAVLLTSDHGNTWARGIGRPKEGVLVETRGERARVYTAPEFLAVGKQQSPTAIEWTNVGLPPDVRVLLAPALGAFIHAGDQAVCHGGISVEELIVPFIEITRD